MYSILYFNSNDLLNQFVDVLINQRKDIALKIKVSYTDFVILIKDLNPEQEQWIRDHIVEYGQYQKDEQLETF